MKARDIMTPNPRSVTPDDSLTQAARLMRELDVGSVPVMESTASNRLEGIITDRDIAVGHVAEGHGSDCSVRHHMSADRIGTVAPDDDVDKVLEVMKRRQVRRIPVVGPEGQIVGIIAQADIAREGVEEPKVGDVVGEISEPEKRAR